MQTGLLKLSRTGFECWKFNFHINNFAYKSQYNSFRHQLIQLLRILTILDQGITYGIQFGEGLKSTHPKTPQLLRVWVFLACSL